jgi:hypothetical protein
MASKTFYCTKDAHMGKQISGTFNGWNGKDNHLNVGASSDYKWRACLYFSVNFTGMTTITSATLHLFSNTVGTVHLSQTDPPSTLKVARMTADWGEGGVDPGEGNLTTSLTWDWNNRFDKYTNTGSNTKSIDLGGDGTQETISVTDIVTAWFNGADNNGIMLINDSSESNDDKGLNFYSRDFNSEYRPYLVIEYTSNVAPNAPTALSPTGSELKNTLIPTFSGTFSDADAGDTQSYVQIQLYEDDGTTLKWDSGALASATSGAWSKAYTGPSLTGNLYYKWKARSFDAAGEAGPYSALQRFKVNSTPSAPTISLTETPTTDILTLTPTFNVTHIDGDPTDNKMYGYRIILETSAGVAVWDSGDISTSGAPVSTVAVTYAGPALLWNTDYRWRARTRDSNLVWGPYNTTNSTFSTYGTATPINLNGTATIVGTAGGGNDTISITASRGDSRDVISSYRIIIYGPNSTTTVLSNTGILTTGISGGASISYTYTGSLAYGSTYYFKILFNEKATGEYFGGISAYTALASAVTPADATVPTQTAPLGQQATGTGDLTPNFTGGRSTNFDRFQIVVEVYNPDTGVYSAHSDTGTVSQTSAASYNHTYAGTALTWNTQYRWKVRVGVGSVAASTYSGWAVFRTEEAGVPTLTSPIDTVNYWQSTGLPTFTGSRSGTDTIDQVNYQIWNSTATTLIYDSGWVNVTNATTFSIVYASTSLGAGVYKWRARYMNSLGPYGDFSNFASFRVNAPPSVPQNLYPEPGGFFNDTLLPLFKATFVDADKQDLGDFPKATGGWVIIIKKVSDDTTVVTKTLNGNSTGVNSGSGSFNTGQNTYQYQAGDTTLLYDTEYKWSTYFVDSKNFSGYPSSYQTFTLGQSPSGTITSPTDGSVVDTTRPQITWTFTGSGAKTQSKWRLDLTRDDGVALTPITQNNANLSYTINAGILRNGRSYTAKLTVTDSAGMADPSPSETTFTVNTDAPNEVPGLSATVYENLSLVELTWDSSDIVAKAGQTFQYYAIYRKGVTDVTWVEIGTQQTFTRDYFYDWYAGQGIQYQYRVTQVVETADETTLESGDSDIPTAMLTSDVFMVIGADRDASHIFELFVSGEEHSKPVQQEIFEPVGSSRKVIARGQALGTEGTLTVTWLNHDVYADNGEAVNYEVGVDPNRAVINETVLARRRLDYLVNTSGPHILKTPFGDVWDVEFAGPISTYSLGGHMQVELTYTEVSVNLGAVEVN